MKFVKALSAAALLAVSLSSFAATVELELTEDGFADAFTVTGNKNQTSKTYDYSFSFDSVQNVEFFWSVAPRTPSSTGTASLDVKLDGVSFSSFTNQATFESNTFWSQLSAGTHTLSFSGFGSNGYKGLSSFSVTNVAPVPEPETYALMGLGLVGLLAARRRKQQD